MPRFASQLNRRCEKAGSGVRCRLYACRGCCSHVQHLHSRWYRLVLPQQQQRQQQQQQQQQQQWMRRNWRWGRVNSQQMHYPTCLHRTMRTPLLGRACSNPCSLCFTTCLSPCFDAWASTQIATCALLGSTWLSRSPSNSRRACWRLQLRHKPPVYKRPSSVT